MKKRLVLLLLVFALGVSLCACKSEETAVNVQRVDRLTGVSQMGERFAGIVVSEHVEQIQKDANKTVREIYVTEGQNVSKGDKLFSYDSDALQLELEKQQLELNKLKQEKGNLASQLSELQQQLKSASDSATKARLTLEVNTIKTNQMENDYQLAGKEKEVDALKESAEHTDVLSTIDGTVRQISEGAESGVLMTIQPSGAFKVKGSISELNLGSGLSAGTRLRIFSRVDPSKSWLGTVTEVDIKTAADGEQNQEDGGQTEMTAATSYPFYVELDNTDGLLLGQHIYMEPANEEAKAGIWILEQYLTNLDAENGTAQVWADNGKGQLELRNVTVGQYDEEQASYEITEGLSMEDYLADPTSGNCKVGAPVTYRKAEDFGGEADSEAESVPEETDQEEVTFDDFSSEEQVETEEAE